MLASIISSASCDKKPKNIENDQQLLLQRRSFMQFLDDEKLKSYLSSFGEQVMESKQHMVYKRASSRTRKLKKTSPTSTAKPEVIPRNERPKNMTISPRHMIKFELEDAKYSEDYEKLRKNRKLRVKRSAQKNETAFIEPKEFFRFLLSDAVTKSPETSATKSERKVKEEKKTKREVNPSDSIGSDSRKIKITHPLSSTRKNKFVTLDELPIKMQKFIESALINVHDKVSDADYLKFYYGDRVIKVPASLYKYLPLKKETTTKSTIIENYGFKSSPKYHEVKQEYEKITEAPQLLGTKSSYYKVQPSFKSFSIPEKAESYVNFESPKVKNPFSHEKQVVEEPKKSYYFYSSDEKKSVGPILFEASTPKPSLSSVEPKKEIFENYVRETIPITEDFSERKPYLPLHTRVEVSPKQLMSYPAPTSYVEYSDDDSRNHHADVHENKNYEFG